MYMKNQFLKRLIVLFGLVLFVECNKENNTSPIVLLQNQSQQKATNATMPKADHIVIVIEENHGYSQINGSSSAPYINSLAKDSFSVKFTNSYAITYGSQRDYLDLYSGSDQGASGGSHPANEPFTTANLGRQLIDAGKSYSTYSQGLPYTVIMTIVRELMYEGIIQQRIGWEKGQTRFQAQPINHLQHFLLILQNCQQ